MFLYAFIIGVSGQCGQYTQSKEVECYTLFLTLVLLLNVCKLKLRALSGSQLKIFEEKKKDDGEVKKQLSALKNSHFSLLFWVINNSHWTCSDTALPKHCTLFHSNISQVQQASW